MSPNSGKVKEVKEWPTPRNKTEFEKFLGLNCLNMEHLQISLPVYIDQRGPR